MPENPYSSPNCETRKSSASLWKRRFSIPLPLVCLLASILLVIATVYLAEIVVQVFPWRNLSPDQSFALYFLPLSLIGTLAMTLITIGLYKKRSRLVQVGLLMLVAGILVHYVI